MKLIGLEIEEISETKTILKASSPEFVGELLFRQFSKLMI